MNGDSSPHTELLLTQIHRMADRRKQNNGDAVKDEDNSEGLSDLLVLGFDHRCEGGHRGTPTDCCTRCQKFSADIIGPKQL